jgi:hypothetical protein
MNQKKANTVLRNGAIYTVDAERSWAQAIAISDDKIVFVGSDSKVEQYIGSGTTVIELDGKMVLPGFIDSHAHPSHGMDYFQNINLYLLDSREKYIEAISDYVKDHPEAETIRGSGWSDSLFPNTGPTRDILDDIVPDRPVSLTSLDGHSLWVNSAALEKAKITKDTPNPKGGVIEHDPKTGEPNGTLRETAMPMVTDVLPEYSVEERKKALVAYQEMAASVGVTMVHDSMVDMQTINAYNELKDEGLLKMRFRGSVTLEPKKYPDQLEELIRERSRNTHPYFQIHTGKIFVDGVIEGGTALLLEPYKHKPDFLGDPIWDTEVLNTLAVALDKENLQIHIHAIGDAATRISLDAFEHAQQINGKRDSRHLITHLQLVTPKDIQRFQSLGVVGVPQPFWFKIDEYYWTLALPYLGKERADLQYPMQSFINAGVVMASASDFPVTIPFDPLIAIQTGITRSDMGKTPENILWPEERASLEDMLASYTINGAYANFLENEIGSIEVGKQADLIVLDHNLFEISINEITQVNVLLTLVGGREVYQNSEFNLQH